MSEQAKEIIQEEEIIPQETTQTEQEQIEVVEKNISETEKLQTELNEWKDKYMRLFAEFDNYKKRSFKEKMETIQTAGKELMISLLEVVDDSERAEKQMETASDIDSVKSGIKLIINKLNNTLSSKGLKSFVSTGENFDVEKHEAITEIPAPTPELQGKVIDEVQKGYYLNDKLIRHAKVVVGKTEEN